MSIGGTPLNSDQLLGRLQDLQSSHGSRELVLGKNGEVSAKATPFERFCNFFTLKKSSPKQEDSFKALQTILERDYGQIGKDISSAILGQNRQDITINDAIKLISATKEQYQKQIGNHPLAKLVSPQMSDVEQKKFLAQMQSFARSNPSDMQRLGISLNSVIKLLQPNEAQKKALCELVMCAKDPKEVLAFLYAASNNPSGAGKFLSNLAREPQMQKCLLGFLKSPNPFVGFAAHFSQLSQGDRVLQTATLIQQNISRSLPTTGFEYATQGAIELSKNLITESGKLASDSFIFGLESVLRNGTIIPPPDNEFAIHQLDRLRHDKGLQEQLLNIGKNGVSPSAHQAIRETLGLPPTAPITTKEAQQAALATILSPIRQGSVGSCFATSVAINIHDTRPSDMLRDMSSLIERGYIERQNGSARIAIPLNQSIFRSQIQLKTTFVPMGTQMVAVQKPERQITGNPLLRCLEYTLATSSENQLCSHRNQEIRQLASQALNPQMVEKFMQSVGFEYDASKLLTSSVDGSSSMGAFTINYRSPRTGNIVQIQTPQDLHWAVQDFSGRTVRMTYGPQFQFGGLGGGVLENVLAAQYGIPDLQTTRLDGGHQALPDMLLNIAGRVSQEAKRVGANMPLSIPITNQGHGFNLRLNDPILQEGVRTGAFDSPAKRQAFLRKQLMEPMLAQTSNLRNPKSAAEFSRFSTDLTNQLALNGIPPQVSANILYGIQNSLQNKNYSHADLAKVTYQTFKRAFPQLPDQILSDKVMMALAPMCPKMMFADTNWAHPTSGKPMHWGMQFNPLTGQFGMLQGTHQGSGNYTFDTPCQMAPSTFDHCTVITDPRVVFRAN